MDADRPAPREDPGRPSPAEHPARPAPGEGLRVEEALAIGFGRPGAYTITVELRAPELGTTATAPPLTVEVEAATSVR